MSGNLIINISHIIIMLEIILLTSFKDSNLISIIAGDHLASLETNQVNLEAEVEAEVDVEVVEVIIITGNLTKILT